MAGPGKPGPAPRAHLTAVRDGNPGRRPVKPTPTLPPAKPVEPRWAEIFPIRRGAPAKLRGEVTRCRNVARGCWRQTVGILYGQGLANKLDEPTLLDLAVCVAQLDMATRDISRRGLIVETDRGQVMNRSVTAAQQFRGQFKAYVSLLGLAPAARVGLTSAWDPGGGSDDDDDGPFD